MKRILLVMLLLFMASLSSAEIVCTPEWINWGLQHPGEAEDCHNEILEFCQNNPTRNDCIFWADIYDINLGNDDGIGEGDSNGDGIGLGGGGTTETPKICSSVFDGFDCIMEIMGGWTGGFFSAITPVFYFIFLLLIAGFITFIFVSLQRSIS